MAYIPHITLVIAALMLALPVVVARAREQAEWQTDLPRMKTQPGGDGFVLLEKEFESALSDFGGFKSPIVPASDFRPKKHREPLEPPPAPVAKFDRLAEFKRQLREMTYGEFIEAAEGLGFAPRKAWEWATA